MPSKNRNLKGERMSRRMRRGLPKYTVFRNGRQLSEFAYPKERAEYVFEDLLAADPHNQLLPIETKQRGDGLRTTTVKFPSTARPKSRAA